MLARGDIPCEVLFLGEAPGSSENISGYPFVGPAGQLLDQQIKDAEELSRPISKAFTNLVACIPLGEEGRKVKEPSDESITKCAPRLQEFVQIASPKLIVCVGSLADRRVNRVVEYNCNYVSIRHPAAILRMGIEQQGLEIQKVIVTLCDAFDDL